MQPTEPQAFAIFKPINGGKRDTNRSQTRPTAKAFPVTDPVARETLAERCIENEVQLRHFLQRLLFDFHRAEEVTQQVFLIAFIHVGKLCHVSQDLMWQFLGDEESVRKWMFGTARRTAANLCRRLAIWQTKLNVLQTQMASAQEPLANHEATVDDADEAEEVWNQIRALSPHDRAIIELKLNGVTLDEIGRLIGLSRYVIYRRIQNVQRCLKDRVRPHPFRQCK